MRPTRPLACLMLLGILLGACGTLEVDQARETEQMLVAAGFRVKLADTPEKLEFVDDLDQLKLLAHTQGDARYYFFADALRCRCVYWGSEAAYQRFRQLAMDRLIDEDRMNAEPEDKDAPMNWSLWGTGRRWEY